MPKHISMIAAACLAAGTANAAEDIMVVFDGSNSMWGQIDGTAKIEIARRSMESLMGDWVEGTNLGLMAYGHRREADCTDIETIIPPGPNARNAFLERVQGITPRGKTPLTAAVEEAARQLSYRDNPATVVLISDGIESCQRDPCALADELEQSGVDFTAHVIGFGLATEEEQASIACIAERTGGRFIAASDAAELGDALGAVSAEVASVGAPEPEPEPEPEEVPSLDVTAPASATVGSEFDVSWSRSIDPGDFVTVVPAGAEEGAIDDHVRVRDKSGDSLRAPAEPGLYEVRYVSEKGRRTLASIPVGVTEAEVDVSAPETAVAGATFAVSWSRAIHPGDFVTVVPAGAEDGIVEDHVRVRDKSDDSLRAPAEPGLYEVRYVLEKGRRTLASSPIEVTPAEAELTAPETAVAGASLEVSWSRAIHPGDFVTVVPAGAEDGTVNDHVRVRDKSGDSLRAPAVPGLYEVRYVLEEGRKTLASRPIEVVAAEAELAAPQTALAGAAFDVSWSQAIHPGDFVTVVPAGAEDGTVEDHVRVRDKSGDSLRAPAEPGLYEVRYVLEKGRRTLASTPIEVTEPEVQVTATGPVRADDEIEVTWSGDVPHPGDYITIVPQGTAEGDVGDHVRVREVRSAALRAPDETGMYEVRYVLERGRRTLARATVEVVDSNAAIDTGGTLDVPETAAPGEEIQVSWTSSSESSRQRISLARSNQADFTWIEAQPATNEPPLFFTMPEEPGHYEFRLLDLAGPDVLSRAMVEVR